MAVTMVVSIFVTIVNVFIEFNYKDLLTAVKCRVAGSAIVFSGFL